jgi:hypothetical protein
METARECYYAMRELVVRHPGGTSSESAAATVRELCRIAAQAADDATCAAALAQVEAYGTELFSGCGSGNWVRRRLLRALEEYQARLAVLEALRRPVRRRLAASS